MPSAEKLPGSFGMTTRGIEISRAIATACSGPAPPKAISVVSRGSMPRLTETARTASDMAPSAMVVIPSAASTVPSPSRSPIAADRGLGERAVELHVAAEEARAVEAAEHEIGVGHRRRLAAAAVAGRARIGARAHRPDMQAAAVVAPGERAAAGADLDDVDHRQLHRLAGELVADHVAFLDRRDARR